MFPRCQHFFSNNRLFTHFTKSWQGCNAEFNILEDSRLLCVFPLLRVCAIARAHRAAQTPLWLISSFPSPIRPVRCHSFHHSPFNYTVLYLRLVCVGHKTQTLHSVHTQPLPDSLAFSSACPSNLHRAFWKWLH